MIGIGGAALVQYRPQIQGVGRISSEHKDVNDDDDRGEIHVG